MTNSWSFFQRRKMFTKKNRPLFNCFYYQPFPISPNEISFCHIHRLLTFLLCTQAVHKCAIPVRKFCYLNMENIPCNQILLSYGKNSYFLLRQVSVTEMSWLWNYLFCLLLRFSFLVCSHITLQNIAGISETVKYKFRFTAFN